MDSNARQQAIAAMRSLDIIPYVDSFYESRLDAALSALSAAGYAVVPVEPTEAMLRAGANRWDTHHPSTTETYPNERATWRAMLAAANPPDTKKPAETDPAG